MWEMSKNMLVIIAAFQVFLMHSVDFSTQKIVKSCSCVQVFKMSEEGLTRVCSGNTLSLQSKGGLSRLHYLKIMTAWYFLVSHTRILSSLLLILHALMFSVT
jgi:hypothetical protein